MRKTRTLALCFFPLLVSLLAAGCGGSGPALAPVEGRVTLDGKPLPGARVEFDPDTELVAYGKSSSSTSYGTTDSGGRYQLKYTGEQDGAMVGKHLVRISTRNMTVDAEGKEVLVPEQLPTKYNVKSELTAEVKPGSNKIDFPLTIESSPGGNE